MGHCHIAVLQYMIKFEKKEYIMSLKLVFSSKGQVETCKIARNCTVYLWLQEVQSFL